MTPLIFCNLNHQRVLFFFFVGYSFQFCHLSFNGIIYLLLFLKSSRSCVLLTNPFNSVICPSMISWKGKFLLRIWRVQFAFLGGILSTIDSCSRQTECPLEVVMLHSNTNTTVDKIKQTAVFAVPSRLRCMILQAWYSNYIGYKLVWQGADWVIYNTGLNRTVRVWYYPLVGISMMILFFIVCVCVCVSMIIIRN